MITNPLTLVVVDSVLAPEENAPLRIGRVGGVDKAKVISDHL